MGKARRLLYFPLFSTLRGLWFRVIVLHLEGKYIDHCYFALILLARKRKERGMSK
jgi:hypothetical protein